MWGNFPRIPSCFSLHLRGKGRGASTSKTSSVVGTRANPNVMAEGEGNERSDMGEMERVKLTPSSSSGGAGMGESGAGSESKHEGKKRREIARANLMKRIGDLRVSLTGRANFRNQLKLLNMCTSKSPCSLRRVCGRAITVTSHSSSPRKMRTYLGKSGLLKRGGVHEKNHLAENKNNYAVGKVLLEIHLPHDGSTYPGNSDNDIVHAYDY